MSYFRRIENELSIDLDSQFPPMEHDPLKQLTEFFKSEGYVGKEAVEEAKAELKRRHKRELELKQAGKNHHLVSFV